MKCLIVDDCWIMIHIMRELLVALGHRDITVTDSACNALALLNKQYFDVVFTDWNMPDMSGLDFIRIIRATKKTRYQMIIMVSAESALEQIEKVQSYIIDDYILKPLNRKTLAKKINRLMKHDTEKRRHLIDLCHKRLVMRLENRIAMEAGKQLSEDCQKFTSVHNDKEQSS